jgi:hypothetical protein
MQIGVKWEKETLVPRVMQSRLPGGRHATAANFDLVWVVKKKKKKTLPNAELRSQISSHIYDGLAHHMQLMSHVMLR